jgi:hypothetical protein
VGTVGLQHENFFNNILCLPSSFPIGAAQGREVGRHAPSFPSGVYWLPICHDVEFGLAGTGWGQEIGA